MHVDDVDEGDDVDAAKLLHLAAHGTAETKQSIDAMTKVFTAMVSTPVEVHVAVEVRDSTRNEV